MRRRTFIGTCGIASMAAIGGCLGSDDDEENGEGANGEGENGEEENGEEENGEEENGEEENGEEENGEEENGDEDTLAVAEFSGTGPETTDSFELEDGFAGLRIDPIEGMAVDVVTMDGNVARSAEWDIRNYQGFLPLSMGAGEYELDIEVDEDVEWTITVYNDPADGATALDLPSTVEGSESEYTGPIDFSEGVTASVDYEGEGGFFLKLFALGGDYIEEIYYEEGAVEDEFEIDYDEWGWILITASEDYEVTFDESEE